MCVSVLVFMCRDPGDTTSKVSCCVESSQCFKNSKKKCPYLSHWKWIWAENENTVDLKSGVFIVIMLINKHLTWVHSQKDPRLHSGERFTLSIFFYMFCKIGDLDWLASSSNGLNRNVRDGLTTLCSFVDSDIKLEYFQPYACYCSVDSF